MNPNLSSRKQLDSEKPNHSLEVVSVLHNILKFFIGSSDVTKLKHCLSFLPYHQAKLSKYFVVLRKMEYQTHCNSLSVLHFVTPPCCSFH